MWFHMKIALELSKARVLVLKNPKYHLKRSKPYNHLKLTLKQKRISEYTKMCISIKNGSKSHVISSYERIYLNLDLKGKKYSKIF